MSWSVFNNISLVSNDYLSFVYDYGYYIKPSNIDGNGIRFFITGRGSLKTFGELKWDLIPFYDYLVNNYVLGLESTVGKNIGDIRYSSLQLSTHERKFVDPLLIKLNERDLLDKDLSEYDEYYLSCISFYINLSDKEWIKYQKLNKLLDDFNESR